MFTCNGHPGTKLVRAVMFMLLGALALLGPQSTLAAPATKPLVTDPLLFAGANVPWFNWACDFGCGANGGASSPASRAALADGFSRLKAAGVHTVRWWAFEGDAKQIKRDASGAPTGLDPAVYPDFDAALALADQYDLVYDFVLFSSPTAVPSRWITEPGQRQGLADALTPLFERYKNHPRILAWEIVNEPEWDLWNNKIATEPVQATVKLLANTIHAHTNTAVTVGSASLEGLPLWLNQSLDFYSPHWYDPMSSGDGCARCTDVASVVARYSLDGLPIVLGEFYAGPDTDALQRWTDFRAKGFSAAWAWSLFADKTGDKLRIDLPAVTTFASAPGPAPAPRPASTPLPAIQPRTIKLLLGWVSPTYASPGQDIVIHQDVQSTQDTQDTQVLVDFGIYDGTGERILQTTLDNQPLITDSVSSFSTTMTLPITLGAGEYTVKTVVYSRDGGALLAGNDSVGSFVVDTSTMDKPAPSVPLPSDSPPDSDSNAASRSFVGF